MTKLLNPAIALLAGATILVTGACAATDSTDTSADSADSADAPTTEAPEAPPADEQATSEGTYKNADTEDGQGNISGEVQWNSEGVANLDVMLCSELSTILGLSCDGEEFNTKTAEDGSFSFENVPADGYNLAVRVFDTDNWVFPTEGYGPTAAELKVEEKKELKVPTVDIYKLMDVSAPADEGTVENATPTLSWPEIPEADYYELYLSARDNSEPYESAIVGFRVDGTEHTVETALAKCEYIWRIEAFNADEVKIASTDLVSFKVAGCTPPSDS
ncbi:MAG: hypothetical protein ACPGVO_00230 [Spirulinaceae cyanobacterium]